MNKLMVKGGRVVEVEVEQAVEPVSVAARVLYACKLLGAFVGSCGICLAAGMELARWTLL